jgi:hypothetical protein
VAFAFSKWPLLSGDPQTAGFSGVRLRAKNSFFIECNIRKRAWYVKGILARGISARALGFGLEGYAVVVLPAPLGLIFGSKNEAKYPLPPFPFAVYFWGENLDWARGWWRDSQKHRLGSQLAAAKPKGFPQRKARPFLWKNRRLVVLRSVAPPPRPGEALELLEPFLFFEK